MRRDLRRRSARCLTAACRTGRRACRPSAISRSCRRWRGLPPEAALGTIQQATRRYAKRQMTWFRANPAVQWLDASAGADEIFRAALQKAADFDSGI